MKFKKIMTGLLCLTVLLSTKLVFADSRDEGPGPVPINEGIIKEEFLIGSFTATVKDIKDYNQIEGAKFISLEDKDEMPINMIVSRDTYLIPQVEISVGDIVTGYYNANSPMIAIYPPQYNPFVVVFENSDYNVKVDLFNEDLVSSDNMLKLNISEDTKIVTRDGKAFTGELSHRKLAVIYDVSTKSIPAQTTPIEIIVLSETSPAEDFHDKDVSKMNIIVNGKKIKSLPAYTNHEGNVMVPLRAVAEGLGFNVVWSGQDENITVGRVPGENIFLKIASKSYTDFNGEPIVLESAPNISEETTFVPLDFFKKVLGMNNAYVFEGQIDINNQEEMH